ncbi:MAG: hypothetical protein M3433_05755, partial [Actinomycetota bacterium]|nr:hypothetical protein [Actinomycetota bacterium]
MGYLLPCFLLRARLGLGLALRLVLDVVRPVLEVGLFGRLGGWAPSPSPPPPSLAVGAGSGGGSEAGRGST